MQERDWNAIFGKPTVESEPDEHWERLAQSASSLTAASAAGETAIRLDASSLTAAGSRDTPLINPRPMMSGALVHRFLAYPTQKPKPTSNKETYPTQKPKSKSKASPRTHSEYFLTPSTFEIMRRRMGTGNKPWRPYTTTGLQEVLLPELDD